MSATVVTKDNFQSLVIENEKPVLIDFWASWCGPCRMVLPIVDEIAAENPQYFIGKVNVDEQPELANKFNVSSVPTLIAFKNGKAVNKSIGARPKAQILALLG